MIQTCFFLCSIWSIWDNSIPTFGGIFWNKDARGGGVSWLRKHLIFLISLKLLCEGWANEFYDNFSPQLPPGKALTTKLERKHCLGFKFPNLLQKNLCIMFLAASKAKFDCSGFGDDEVLPFEIVLGCVAAWLRSLCSDHSWGLECPFWPNFFVKCIFNVYINKNNWG